MREHRTETEGSTCIDRSPLAGFSAATICANDIDSTKLKCCTSRARLVPESTGLREGPRRSAGQLLEDSRAQPERRAHLPYS